MFKSNNKRIYVFLIVAMYVGLFFLADVMGAAPYNNMFGIYQVYFIVFLYIMSVFGLSARILRADGDIDKIAAFEDFLIFYFALFGVLSFLTLFIDLKNPFILVLVKCSTLNVVSIFYLDYLLKSKKADKMNVK